MKVKGGIIGIISILVIVVAFFFGGFGSEEFKDSKGCEYEADYDISTGIAQLVEKCTNLKVGEECEDVFKIKIKKKWCPEGTVIEETKPDNVKSPENIKLEEKDIVILPKEEIKPEDKPKEEIKPEDKPKEEIKPEDKPKEEIKPEDKPKEEIK
jgi:hypothetical protein